MPRESPEVKKIKNKLKSEEIAQMYGFLVGYQGFKLGFERVFYRPDVVWFKDMVKEENARIIFEIEGSEKETSRKGKKAVMGSLALGNIVSKRYQIPIHFFLIFGKWNEKSFLKRVRIFQKIYPNPRFNILPISVEKLSESTVIKLVKTNLEKIDLKMI